MKKIITAIFEVIKEIQQARADAMFKGRYWS